jgi:glycosyltransferase involved in cell wall biosynthesis
MNQDRGVEFTVNPEHSGQPEGLNADVQRHRIAIFMPVYNAQADFEATMESLSQSTEPFDIVVVDDGSCPPLDVSGFRVHLIRLPQNRGQIAAANAGLAVILQQNYEYIARMDAGDVAHPERLSKQAAFFDCHPDCMMVGCDTDVFSGGEYQFTIKPPRDGKHLAAGLREHAWLLHSTIMFRASVLARVGVYSDEFKMAEDYEICVRIATRYPVGVVPECLVWTDFKPTGITLNNRRTQILSRMRIQRKYFSWNCSASYRGVFKSVVSLLLPYSAVCWLKTNLIYDYAGGPTGMPMMPNKTQAPPTLHGHA